MNVKKALSKTWNRRFGTPGTSRIPGISGTSQKLLFSFSFNFFFYIRNTCFVRDSKVDFIYSSVTGIMHIARFISAF